MPLSSQCWKTLSFLQKDGFPLLKRSKHTYYFDFLVIVVVLENFYNHWALLKVLILNLCTHIEHFSNSFSWSKWVFSEGKGVNWDNEWLREKKKQVRKVSPYLEAVVSSKKQNLVRFIPGVSNQEWLCPRTHLGNLETFGAVIIGRGEGFWHLVNAVKHPNGT